MINHPCQRQACDSSDLTIFENNQKYSPVFDEAWQQWNQLRGQATIPLAKDFDPMASMAVFRNMVYTEVLAGPPLDFCFRIIGTRIDERMGTNYTNRRLSEFDRSKSGTNIWETYEHVVAHKTPCLATFSYVGPIDGIEETIELSLPFANRDGKICNVMGVIQFVGDATVTMNQTRWMPD